MGLIKRLQAITFGIWLGIFLTGAAFGGEIYSCVDKEGKKRIQNNPCTSKENTIDRQVFTKAPPRALSSAGGKAEVILHPSQAGYEVSRAGRPATPPTGMEAAIAAQEKYNEGQRQAKLRAAEQAAASGPAWSAGNRYKAALGAFSNTGGNLNLPPAPVFSPPAPPRSAINVQTGEVYPGVAGGVINPRNGQFYPDVGAGYINPRTGQFMPKQ